MKKISILFVLICFTMVGFAQIPNAGFEEWETSTKASAWNSTFTFSRMLDLNGIPFPLSFNYTAAERNSDAHSGSYAMDLKPYTIALAQVTLPGMCQLGQFDLSLFETADLSSMDMSSINFTDIFQGGVACNELPLKVNAWIKYLADEDTAMVLVVSTRYQNGVREIVAMGNLQITEPVGEYTQFEVPVNVILEDATPDTLNIIFSNGVGQIHGSDIEMFIDDVIMETASGIFDVNAFLFSVMPNPATDQIVLRSINNDKYDARLYDMNGRVVWSGQNLQNMTEINVSDFANGTYVMQVKQNGKVRSEKIMIQ